MTAARHPLRIAQFRSYWAARFAMTIAQNAMIIVIGWQTYTIARTTMSPAGAAAQLGLIGLLQFVPLFVTTPLTGWVADRFDRRLITRCTLALQVTCALILALVTYSGGMTLPVLFSVAVLLGLGRAFAGPAFGALAPNLVPREVLPTAIALSSISWQVGTIVGPALGGFAYAAAPWGAYALATVLFAVALACMLTIPPVPRTITPNKGNPLRQIVDGLSYVGQNKLVLGAITLDLFAVFLAGTSALLPIYAHDILKVGPQGLSLLAAAPAAGASVVALFFSFRPIKTNVGPKMLGAVLVYGVATVVFGLSQIMALSLGALAVAGAADMFSVYIRQSLITLHTPDDKRGRVGAVSQLTISASNELGEAESGFLAAALGPVGAVLVGGGGAIVVTILWTYLFPSIRNAKTFDLPKSAQDSRDLELEATP
ncbi:MFS transporter [Sphingomonas sp. 10B4]|uniref:MFS transporter n=1 Tax=Sphingomonas sp. 10B4 TaxID=3048575 RepID=UPI002AB55827|nr:MFS transporter [Sphingomonas sp. 10B4]MDY7525251.1 MFS transporter [Sphingomonas sp. 10B4]MEB0282076.1 MFS transporter [Sphingomonas sp. 10B4]